MSYLEYDEMCNIGNSLHNMYEIFFSIMCNLLPFQIFTARSLCSLEIAENAEKDFLSIKTFALVCAGLCVSLANKIFWTLIILTDTDSSCTLCCTCTGGIS